MKWRPKNYKNPYKEHTQWDWDGDLGIGRTLLSAGEAVEEDKHLIFEAGADAMLEKLKEEGLEIGDGDYAEVETDWFSEGTVRIPRKRCEYLGHSWLVFIPEELKK